MSANFRFNLGKIGLEIKDGKLTSGELVMYASFSSISTIAELLACQKHMSRWELIGMLNALRFIQTGVFKYDKILVCDYLMPENLINVFCEFLSTYVVTRAGEDYISMPRVTYSSLIPERVMEAVDESVAEVEIQLTEERKNTMSYHRQDPSTYMEKAKAERYVQDVYSSRVSELMDIVLSSGHTGRFLFPHDGAGVGYRACISLGKTVESYEVSEVMVDIAHENDNRVMKGVLPLETLKNNDLVIISHCLDFDPELLLRIQAHVEEAGLEVKIIVYEAKSGHKGTGKLKSITDHISSTFEFALLTIATQFGTLGQVKCWLKLASHMRIHVDDITVVKHIKNLNKLHYFPKVTTTCSRSLEMLRQFLPDVSLEEYSIESTYVYDSVIKVPHGTFFNVRFGVIHSLEVGPQGDYHLLEVDRSSHHYGKFYLEPSDKTYILNRESVLSVNGTPRYVMDLSTKQARIYVDSEDISPLDIVEMDDPVPVIVYAPPTYRNRRYDREPSSKKPELKIRVDPDCPPPSDKASDVRDYKDFVMKSFVEKKHRRRVDDGRPRGRGGTKRGGGRGRGRGRQRPRKGEESSD